MASSVGKTCVYLFCMYFLQFQTYILTHIPKNVLDVVNSLLDPWKLYICEMYYFADLNFVLIFSGYSAAVEGTKTLTVDAETHLYSKHLGTDF